MSLIVDLNADVGESVNGLSPGDADLIPLLTSASIACGLHAGDPETMRTTVALAGDHQVAVGAHPGLADPEGFGRRELPVSPRQVENLVAYQIGALGAVAAREGAPLRHVKVHGALYTMAARDDRLAGAVARAVASVDRRLILFAPSGSCMARAAAELALRVAHEAFADRAYEADGTLTPRTRPGALVADAATVTRRVVEMVRTRSVTATDGSRVELAIDTICVHGDTPGAAGLAQSIRAALTEAGIALAAPGNR